MIAPSSEWGGFAWGDAYWGAGVPASAAGTTQSSQANALKSTVVLGLSDTPETDLSQYATNLTASGNGAYEEDSARGALVGPRTLYVRLECDPGTDTDHTIIAHSNDAGSDYTYAINLDSSGDFTFAQNASIKKTVAGSGFTAGTLDLSIWWATRTNPDTTGASDAMISEVAFYDHTNSSWHLYEQFTHAISTTDTSWNLMVGGYWNGAAWSRDAPAQVEKWRVDGAFYSTVHHGAHWVAQRAGSPSSVIERQEGLFLDRASGIGNQNEFVGPQPFYVARNQKTSYFRLLSPLVNEVYGSQAGSLTNSYAPTYWHKKPPGSSVYRWSIPWLRWVPVPENCNYIYTRVHVHSTVSAGDSVPIGIRVYSFNRIPVLGKQAYEGQDPPPYEAYFATEVLDIDHGGGSDGQWVVNGLVRISRMDHPSPKFRNTTHLGIAYSIDPASASANDANETLKIQAWQAWPVSYFPADNPGPGGNQDIGG